MTNHYNSETDTLETYNSSTLNNITVITLLGLASAVALHYHITGGLI